jgi:predicted transcriptional regulator
MDEKAVSALAQETRKQIIDELLKKETHASDLARKLEIDRPTICYHLSRLEEVSLVSGKYVILKQDSPGRAAKIYFVNKEKYEQTIKDADQVKAIL